MKTINFSIIEKAPQLYFASGIVYYLYITIILFVNLFTNNTSEGAEFRDLTVLLIETLAIVWLIIFYWMNPIRIWKKAKSDIEELLANPKRNIINWLLKPNTHNKKKTIIKAFILYLFSDILIFLIAYFYIKYHYIDLLETISIGIEFFKESLIPKKLKLGVLTFIVINTFLLIADKNHIQLFYKRLYKILWILKHLMGILLSVYLFIILIEILPVLQDFQLNFNKSISTVLIISINIGFIITEIIIAKEYLNTKRNN